MKCLGTTKGAVAWLEPFGTAEHFGPEGRLAPLEGVPVEPEYTHAWVKEKLEGDFDGQNLVFVKDLAYAVTDRFQFLPKGYRHSFLIRDPLKVFMSYYRVFKKSSVGDTDASLRGWLPQKGFGYGELAELAEYVEKDLGEQLVIVDADDILGCPEVMIEKYCHALNLPFSASILTWEPGMPSNWIVPESVQEAEEKYHWMTNSLSSQSFSKSIQKPVSQDEIPQVVKEMVEVSRPFYDKLYARRILPS